MLDIFIYKENYPLIFTQAIFWVFFGVLMVVYQLVYKQNSLRNLLLLIFSLYFYYLSSGYYFTLLIFSTVVDYVLGNKVFKETDERKRKIYVTISLIVNLGLLGYFKYAYFFTDTFNNIFDTHIQTTNVLALAVNTFFKSTMDVSKIFLPVGISFYTFQTISYTIDIYRRKLEPVKHILDFAFYVSFFPQLVAGPIVRAADFVPQIYQKYRLNQAEFGRAGFLILNGLIKKIFVSDYISINFVDRVFQSPGSYSGFENLMATYGYSIQIYCDFSGYTDIAIGIALLLGYRLPLNFNSPYKATSITDFWRRWHISLSSWLRDYLYISLGGNRKGNIRTYVNLLLTMLLGGLWHGAHMRFIIWGALHGLALAFHKIWMEMLAKVRGSKSDKPEPFVSKLIAGIITFHFVAFCWIYFRASSIADAHAVMSQIVSNFNTALIPEVLVSYKNVFLVMLVGFVGHWLPGSWKRLLQDAFTQAPDFAKATIALAVALLLFQMKASEIQPFIYFQF
ncbi:MBOAT family O-acyltransferase [Flammeovirgaceae bacterium SG7u.111]|nr:MBOAT family O-acyltransferase [Flammeovirgaceae bacterium SG7u.132]WPO35967.1 MBOAT family O-acyltransferase [Flammeovirgaceae bacterium SG7u.111]